MKKTLLTAVLIGSVAILFAATVAAQPYPNPKFAAFYSSNTRINGQLAPIGSIIKAYDPNGVLCGVDTVSGTAGSFGFMSVYGDDPTSTGFDEGAVAGDTIHFTINNHNATFLAGDRVWADQTLKQVDIEATSTVNVSLVTPPQDTLAPLNRIVRITVGVRNDGDGIDFYRAEAENSNTNCSTVRLDSFIYANPGETVLVTFDIQTPLWPGDTLDAVTYTIYSQVDPSKYVTGVVNLYMSITDVDDPDPSLPSGFALHQNYPNPFNPTTRFEYALPSSSSVRFEIINLLGQVVEDIDMGIQSAGTHQFDFNASNLTSGVYFYRISTSFGNQSKKMVLLK